MKNFKLKAAVLLSVTMMIASCKSAPPPSNDVYLKLALKATSSQPPTPNCPKKKPSWEAFPSYLDVETNAPLGHIEQGDQYGLTLTEAKKVDDRNKAAAEAYMTACDEGHAADVQGYTEKDAIRVELYEELTKDKN